jgi:SAM-dependent methyltransferase
MKPFTAISEFYDYILRHVDYDRWYRYIRSLMFRYMSDPDYILELGCGTGKFGAMFSSDDFTIYGMDISFDMLKVAKQRAYNGFRVFCADILNFSLSRKFDFIFAVHDTLNYILKTSDMRRAFSCVRDIMHDKSIFMFDITTEYNITRFFDGKAMKFRTRGVDILWENSYNDNRKLIRSEMTLEDNDGIITREKHVQRIYGVDEMMKILNQEGFKLIDIFSDYSFDPPRDDTVMINFVVMKK